MKKVTRTIETVKYQVTFYDEATDEISKGEYVDYESIPEKDIKRFINNMLSDNGDTRQVVKIKPIEATSALYALPYDVFMKYATRIERAPAEVTEA